MIRLTHIGIVFFATLFALLFLASSPTRETYVAVLPSQKEIPQTTQRGAIDTDKKIEETTAENNARTTTVVSKIAETVADLQEKVAAIANMPAPKPTQSPEEINIVARAALVNIYCTTESGGTSRLYTGSGVIIDPRGIILTNAHVARNFLIENAPALGNTDCIIRAGSPAYPFYDAEILYISPSWVKENAASIKQENPRGTGEHDFALLRITRSLQKDTPLPEQFPHLNPEMDRAKVSVKTPVLIASYPAGFLGSITIQKDLYQTSVIAEIKELFTFKDGATDLFSMGGTAVSQKGSSGSAVVDLNTGKVLGIIVTSSDGATTAERDLQAIVFAHISESMRKDIGFTLNEFLAGDPAVEAASFQKNISPFLLQLLSTQ